MEAKLVNSVLIIQKIVRGFLARRKFEKMLEEVYLKVIFLVNLFENSRFSQGNSENY